MVDAGVAGLFRPMHGGVPWTLALGGLAAAFTAATARASRTGDIALVAGTCAGVAAGAAGFAVLPFARIGTPLAHALPWHGSWLVAAVFGAPAIAALVTAARTRNSDQTVMAVACAGAIAALTVALLGIAAIILFPHSVPDIVGSALPPGTPAAARQAENATEAADPYWGFLVFGGLLALLFWATSRPPETRDLARLLLASLAAPAVALAFVGGAGTIALATGAVVLVAVVRARRGVVAAT
jgi:energy-converting hydrogenase Eha subunit A